MQADHSDAHRSLTDHIRVRQQRDSGSVPNGEIHHAESHNGSRAEGPASATLSQTAPLPAAVQEEARAPEHVEREQQLVTYIRSAVNSFDQVMSDAICPYLQTCCCSTAKFKQFVHTCSDVEHVLQVAKNLGNALASGDPEVDKLFIAAFSQVVLDPKYLNNMDGDSQNVWAC